MIIYSISSCALNYIDKYKDTFTSGLFMCPLLVNTNILQYLSRAIVFQVNLVSKYFGVLNSSIYSDAGNFFLAHQIRISACFTCTYKSYKSYLTDDISPRAGEKSRVFNALVVLEVKYLRRQVTLVFTAVTSKMTSLYAN